MIETIEREETGERRGIAHGDEIGAGRAIRHAGENHAVLVDIVSALQGIDDGIEIENLVVAPPGRVVPCIGEDVDLLRAGQRADLAGAARFVVAAPADAAVQLKADLPAPRRIVGGRYIDGEVVFDAIGSLVAQVDHAGFLSGVGTTELQPLERVVERNAGPEDGVGAARGFGRGIGGPEILESGVQRG